MNKHTKTTSVVLAIVVQLAPMARQVITQITDFSPNIAVIFRWGIGAAALLGGVDAVSGASTVITSPLTATGTNGVPFTYRITTGPQVASSFSATPLPPGLAVNTTSGRITGTPTQVGVTKISLKGCDGGNGCTPVATLTLTIVAGSGGGGGTPPSITTQPANQTVTAGNSASFSVVAAGTAPLTYQWRFNGANIAGATSTSYNIANCQAANAGTYSVLVSNAAGTATSANATLTVNPAPVSPSITTQPSPQSVTTGANVSFNVVATGTAPLFYQWRLNGANIGGATSSSYSINNVQAANAGNYSVLVSNVAGNVTSASAMLTVNTSPVAPTITTPPASQTVSVGANVNFTVTASGTAPLSYQWLFNGSPIGGANGSSFALNNVQTSSAGGYSVTVSNAVGTATSATATLTVNAAPAAPTITTQPSSQTVTAGSTVSFTVVASGSGPLSYQWRRNGANLLGSTSAMLTLNNVQTSQAGSYDVVVSNAGGPVTSAVATLIVQASTGGGGGGDDDEDDDEHRTTAGALTISINGHGSVSPDLSGQMLIVGQSYTLTASPDAGFVFDGWSGSARSSSTTLKFEMKQGLTLQANFVPDPALLRTTFSGLFVAPAGAALESSGAFTLKVKSSGKFSGQLLMADGRYKFGGQFDMDGHVSVMIPRSGSTTLTADFQMDFSTGALTVTGHVSGGTWQADATGDRAPAKPSPFAGTYAATMTDNAESGNVSLVVRSKGQAKLKGTLPSGAAIKQTGFVSDDGQLPVCASVKGDGAVIGWLTVSNGNLTGTLVWLHGDGSSSTLTVQP